jgi:hypothetical protein
MQLKRTIFSAEINEVRYRFAERTMREIENLIREETEAFNSKDVARVKSVHHNFVLNSLNDAGEICTLDDLKDNMGATTFNTLYGAILASQGIKLEAKNLGESQASQSS